MDTIRWNKESDQYTKRAEKNLGESLYHNALDVKDVDWLDLKDIKSVLDIGCAYGSFAGELKKRFPKAEVVGIDPGENTIKMASWKYPEIRFIKGYSDDIPFKTPFDLVVVRCVLQWVPRKLLLRTISEMDRVCGKYIYIKEYVPSQPTTSVSKYNKEVRIFKQDYSNLFLALPYYREVKLMVEHQEDEYHRTKHSLLEKIQLEHAYAENSQK